MRKRFYSPFSFSQIFEFPTQLPAFTALELQVRLYCFYITKVSTPSGLSFSPLNLNIQSLHLDKTILYQKQDEVQYVFGFYIILC